MFTETISQHLSSLKQGLKAFHENEEGAVIELIILIAVAVLLILAIYTYFNEDVIPSIKEKLCEMGIGSC